MPAPHQTDIGVAVILTVKENGIALNISSVTTKQLIFRKPDGTKVTQTAAFTGDGTDGKIQYTTIAGDLDESGDWQVQGKIGGLSGFTGYTDVVQFQVAGNL